MIGSPLKNTRCLKIVTARSHVVRPLTPRSLPLTSALSPRGEGTVRLLKIIRRASGYPANSSRGSALISVLMLIIGLVLGIAILAVMRMGNKDVLKSIAPKEGLKEGGPEEPAAPAPVAWLIPQEAETKERLASINSAEKALKVRQQKMEDLEKSVESRRLQLLSLQEKMNESENRIKGLSLELETSEAKNIKKMAKTWENMDPLKVLILIKSINDTPVAAKILSNMDNKLTALVLEALTLDEKDKVLSADLLKSLNQIKPASVAANAAQGAP